MADITVASGHFGVSPLTLSQNTAQGIAFADNVNAIQVITDGSAHVYVKVGSGDATVPSAGASAGTATYSVPSFAPILNIKLDGSTDRVSIISAGTPGVVVQVA